MLLVFVLHLEFRWFIKFSCYCNRCWFCCCCCWYGVFSSFAFDQFWQINFLFYAAPTAVCVCSNWGFRGGNNKSSLKKFEYVLFNRGDWITCLHVNKARKIYVVYMGTSIWITLYRSSWSQFTCCNWCENQWKQNNTFFSSLRFTNCKFFLFRSLCCFVWNFFADFTIDRRVKTK